MSRLPRLSSIHRALRQMHSDGRQVNHPGPSASPPSAPHVSQSALSPTPAPQSPPSQPPLPSSFLMPDPENPILPGGRALIPVALPNGDPTPSEYPPTSEYFDTIEEKKTAPHPLWKFFHVPIGLTNQLTENSLAPNNMGSIETLEPEDRNLYSGRSWQASELRRKSFADLHTLWYVLLRERNVLATQKEERRRLKIEMSPDSSLLNARSARCRKSMARIKYVLNERRLGLIAAAGPSAAQGVRTHVPWSASGSTDPAGMTAAIFGELEAPTHILRAKPQRTSAEEASVSGEGVAAEEIEARDEGFGGGEEAQEFVDEVEVTDEGKVKKKE
ncbi:hypothetical protein IAT38_006569 [Cryptococcus sp. DSM 104549]